MLSCEVVSDPEIDEPWLGKTREVPAAFPFEEAFDHLVLGIVQLFHLQVETDAASLKPKIGRMRIAWRLVLEVLNIGVAAEQLANRDFKQDI